MSPNANSQTSRLCRVNSFRPWHRFAGRPERPVCGPKTLSVLIGGGNHLTSAQCPLLALSRHSNRTAQRLRSGIKGHHLEKSGHRHSLALKGFPPHWLIPRVAPMQNELSFYSDELGREISCIYSAFGGLLMVTTPTKNFAIGIIKFARNSGAHNAD